MERTSQLEYALLGLLKQQTQSGYDLRKSFTTTPMRHFSDSPGSIYPALRRLQARKWISVAKEVNGRKRQLLRLTKAGEQAFVAWVQKPVTREDVIWRIDELTLRFAFQGGTVAPAVTNAFLHQLETELTAYTRELRNFAAISGLAKSSSTGALAFACGIEGYEAQLAWTKRTRKKFKEAL